LLFRGRVSCTEATGLFRLFTITTPLPSIPTRHSSRVWATCLGGRLSSRCGRWFGGRHYRLPSCWLLLGRTSKCRRSTTVAHRRAAFHSPQSKPSWCGGSLILDWREHRVSSHRREIERKKKHKCNRSWTQSF
jgi:hypothetical protein